jgi:hypothetical protein
VNTLAVLQHTQSYPGLAAGFSPSQRLQEHRPAPRSKHTQHTLDASTAPACTPLCDEHLGSLTSLIESLMACHLPSYAQVDPNATPIYEVEDISQLAVDISSSGTQWGTGGMSTKLTAGRIATAAGCTMVGGGQPDRLGTHEASGRCQQIRGLSAVAWRALACQNFGGVPVGSRGLAVCGVSYG